MSTITKIIRGKTKRLRSFSSSHAAYLKKFKSCHEKNLCLHFITLLSMIIDIAPSFAISSARSRSNHASLRSRVILASHTYSFPIRRPE